MVYCPGIAKAAGAWLRSAPGPRCLREIETLLSRVLRTIREHRLLADGDRVLVAVSGGPDSLALLEVLARLAPRLGLALEVATVDHGLRAGARQEAHGVAAAAAARGLPCAILTVDVAAARTRHVSLQDAARRVRLEALAAHAEQRGCTRIALGHTADDQAETILFRILRGTGVAGLAGIPYQRGRFVRPLLDVRRAEVTAFVRRRGLVPVTDPANDDRRFARARIRHEWLPALARENPRIVEALLALSRSARTPAAGQAPPAGLPPLGLRAAQRLDDLTRAGGSRRLSVPGGVIEVSYGEARFHVGNEPSPPPPAAALAVDAPGAYPWPPGAAPALLVELLLAPPPDGAESAPAGAVFAAEALAAGLVLRAPKPGDRMRPRGGRGSRKLQDLLVDAKIPRARRAGLPVLTTRTGEVLFVPGLRPSEHARPAPEASRVLLVRVR